MQNRYTAFAGDRLLCSGTAAEVALAARAALQHGNEAPIHLFDDLNGRQVDFDLRGTEAEILARLGDTGTPPASKRAGRPKLGVVARELTLLPRHWDWLAAQSGGASATVRKLVDAARKEDGARQTARQAQAAADHFMLAMLGNQPGYEEATRALYAKDGARFQRLSNDWPADLRDHARRLAAPAFPPSDAAAASA